MTQATISESRPLSRAINVNWEIVLWSVIVILAVVTRLWGLGDRAMSHDESLHTFYSWKLFIGEGYQHDPMMHGPLLYHATFLSYFLFGASDFTARLLPVVTGILLIMSPLLLRRWLGAAGAVATGVMLLISPVIMMYSRYIRHDIPVELFTVLMAISFIRYLDDRRGKWIVLALAAGAGAITSAEMAYINGFILMSFVVVALASDRFGDKRGWLGLGMTGLGVGLLAFAMLAGNGAFGDISTATEGIDLKDLVQSSYLFGGVILAWGIGAGMLTGARLSMFGDRITTKRRWTSIGLLALAVPLFAVAYFGRDGGRIDLTFVERIGMQSSTAIAILAILGTIAVVASFCVWLIFGPRVAGGVIAAVGSAPRESLLAAIAVFAVIYTLLFTTFFSNMDGIDGFVRSIRYWIDQHDVVRGGQPWYYYLLLAPMYEYVPLGLGLSAIVTYGLNRKLRFGRGGNTEDGEVAPAAWVFVPLLVTWALGVFWVYSWAGEKMPWLLTHLVVPLAFLGGRFVGDMIDAVDWAVMRERGWQLAGATLLGIGILLAMLIPEPGFESDAGAPAAKWLVAALVIVGLAWLMWNAARSIGAVQSRIPVILAIVFAALILNTRDSVRANFENDELANEYLVYAHGTPDDKLVYEMLRELDERLGQDEPLSVGYDNEVSWPFTWYFRRTDWTKVPTYLGTEPGDVVSLKQHDAVLVGSPNYGKFEPYLRDEYVDIEYGRMWWPNEGYKFLTRETLIDTLTDPRLRRNIANIVFHRRYSVDPLAPEPQQKPLDDWYHHANMKLYLRRDAIERAWPLGQGRPEGLEDVVAQAEERPERIPITVDKVFDGGQSVPLSGPKGIALGPDGTLWVVDHENARVVGLDASGEITSTLSDGTLRYTAGDNTTPPSAWGVDVGPNGEVYVADTWNHRILKFVDGAEVASFGISGIPAADNPDPQLNLLFGPRDVAVDSEGNVFVTDTGNKRIIALDADLNPIRAIGSSGTAQGQFSEPTSLAFDPETGELYVADLWNLRIQVFSKDYVAVREWQVAGWGSQEAAHKAYLAVGPGGIVLASDPSGARVWVYDREGTALGTLDLIDDEEGLDQPIGIDIDEFGSVYVASSNSGIVTRYQPLSLFGAAEQLPTDGDDPGADAVTGDDGTGAEDGDGVQSGDSEDAGADTVEADAEGGEDAVPTTEGSSEDDGAGSGDSSGDDAGGDDESSSGGDGEESSGSGG